MKARPAQGLLAQRLLALFLAGWVLLDFPLLRLALGGGSAGPAPPATLFGLPRLPLLLFAAWALLIVLLVVLMERAGADEDVAASSPERR
jgi:hypothetical protein